MTNADNKHDSTSTPATPAPDTPDNRPTRDVRDNFILVYPDKDNPGKRRSRRLDLDKLFSDT